MDNYLRGIVPKGVWEECEFHQITYQMLREIRVRINQPIMINFEKDGKLQEYISKETATTEIVQEVVNRISNYSLYAYSEELRNGFITVEGGHRIGIAGKAILELNSEGETIIRGIKYINYLNIRVAHEIIGCSRGLIKYLYIDNQIRNTLIISAPCRGKTTILRDLVRNISNGFENVQGIKVALIDERGEIAGSVNGCPQMDVGKRTDVLDGATKIWGMKMLIRSMSPQLIAIDEIGLKRDIDALREANNAGIKIVATIHGTSLEDVEKRNEMRKIVDEKLFDRYVILSSSGRIGKVDKILDCNRRIL